MENFKTPEDNTSQGQRIHIPKHDSLGRFACYGVHCKKIFISANDEGMRTPKEDGLEKYQRCGP